VDSQDPGGTFLRGFQNGPEHLALFIKTCAEFRAAVEADFANEGALGDAPLEQCAFHVPLSHKFGMQAGRRMNVSASAYPFTVLRPCLGRCRHGDRHDPFALASIDQGRGVRMQIDVTMEVEPAYQVIPAHDGVTTTPSSMALTSAMPLRKTDARRDEAI
jgi:hypothetical protein